MKEGGREEEKEEKRTFEGRKGGRYIYIYIFFLFYGDKETDGKSGTPEATGQVLCVRRGAAPSPFSVPRDYNRTPLWICQF